MLLWPSRPHQTYLHPELKWAGLAFAALCGVWFLSVAHPLTVWLCSGRKLICTPGHSPQASLEYTT